MEFLDKNGVARLWAKMKTYVASTGTLTPEDKAKLDGIEKGAQVNQKAYSNISVIGSGNIPADGPSSTLQVQGYDGVNITNTYGTLNFSLEKATSSSSGAMSSDMYIKLDQLPSNSTLSSTYATKSYANNLVADSGWLTLSPASNISHYSGRTVKYRKIGKLVQIVGAFSNNNAFNPNNSLTLATLPSGYRPSNQITSLQQGSGLNRWLMTISTGGTITLGRYSNDNSYASSIASGSWLNVDCMFFIG